MDKENVKSISLKALVDTENKKIIFAESNEEFIDVLFSFLTMPMGTIIRLLRNQPPTVGIGCMNNLYESVENLDMELLRTEACKNMLLYPRNGAADQCKGLKLNINDSELLKSFPGIKGDCTHLSHYRNAICDCKERMDLEKCLLGKECFDDQYRGVFVKELAKLIISDELQVMPPSTEAGLSLLSKLGLIDGSTTEECNLDIGLEEVLTLLKISLVSKTPLTDTFLKHSPAPELNQKDFDNSSYIKSRMEEPASNENGKICIKLTVSKSKKMIYYAEASEDFIDLLFSFLTFPLACILKEMPSSTSKGCINHLYNSIHELDAEQFLKSNEHKEMLVGPKLAPNFTSENLPLGIGEDEKSNLSVVDPKSISEEDTKVGFVKGQAMFTVTDSLIVTPISSISGLLLLNELKVPFSDIEVRPVYVGSEEALRLLVASFVTESALTNAFLREPNPE